MQCTFFTASAVPREKVSVGGAHGQGRSQHDMSMGDANKCGLPVAVTLGGRYRMSPRGQRTFEGSTSPQARFILEHLVRLAREHAVLVPWQSAPPRYYRASESTVAHTAQQSACCRDSTYRR